MLRVQGAALGLGFMGGYYSVLWFLWLPQEFGYLSTDPCSQLLV